MTIDDIHKLGRRCRDYTGVRFGKLLVTECLVKSQGDINSRGLWKCICDCGNEVTVKGESLKSRGRNSCGCLRSIAAQRVCIKRRKYDTFTSNKQYKGHVRRCTTIGFTPLPKEQWLAIVTQPCYYCGEMDTRNGINNTYLNMKGVSLKAEEVHLYAIEINGIDRVDNNRGYELDNCVSCCTICNTMKMNYTQEDFFRKIKLIHNRHL